MSNILKENSKFLFLIEPNCKQYYFLTYLVKGTSQVREIGRTHCFLLIYCKETQKINSLPSQIKKKNMLFNNLVKKNT